MSPIEFRAPWSKSLKLTTGIGTFVLVILFGMSTTLGPHFDRIARAFSICISTLILIAGLASVVRGYAITQDEILIRGLWRTIRLPLPALQTVEGKAEALQRVLPLFANHGFFAWKGWYWCKGIGLCRAYATDFSRAVVLRQSKRTIVITPHDPQAFIMRARTLVKTMAHRA